MLIYVKFCFQVNHLLHTMFEIPASSTVEVIASQEKVNLLTTAPTNFSWPSSSPKPFFDLFAS